MSPNLLLNSWLKRERGGQLSRSFFFCVGIAAASLLLSSCSLVGSRPVQQMAYAEAAMQAATVANAETHPDASQVYLLAKDQMARARSYYRLKNFRLARNLAFRARKLAEEAEWKAIKGAGGGDGGKVESLVK